MSSQSYEVQEKQMRSLLEFFADKKWGMAAASTYENLGTAVEESDLAISTAGFFQFTQDYVTAESSSIFVSSVLGNLSP